MKNLTLNEKTDLLIFINGYWGQYLNCASSWNENKQLHKVMRYSLREYTIIVDNEISKIKNIHNLIEAMTDSDIFRKEMNVLEHGFATATGSNWDKMVVEFRKEKFVINDRNMTVEIFNGENGFS